MKTKLIFSSLLMVLTLTVSAPCLAIGYELEPNLFDSQRAKNILQKAENIFTRNVLNIHDMKLTVDELESIKNKANNCIEKTNKQITLINELVSEKVQETISQMNGDTTKYIKNKQNYYTNMLSNCTLYLLRSQEGIYAINEKIRVLSSKSLLEKSPPITQAISLSKEQLKNTINFENLQKGKSYLISMAFLVFFLLFLVRVSVKKALNHPRITSLQSIDFYKQTISRLTSFLLATWALSLLVLFIKTNSLSNDTLPYFKMLLFSAWIVPLSLTIGVINTQVIKNYVWHINLLIYAIAAVIIFINLLGYQVLSYYLISRLIITALAVLAFYHTIQVALGKSTYFKYLTEKPKLWLKQILGIAHKKRTPPEIVLLKGCLFIFIVTLFILLMISVWSTSDNFVDKSYSFIIEGFKVFDVKFNFFRIFISILIFSFILLGTRIISTYIANYHHKLEETDDQVALASIVMYVGFGLATVTALLLSGVTFTGLAIVVGALSVGIGLGLQSIVNNFISGILLLIEKPIKPGDRVIIGDTEGHVKKIRIRSTQVKTLAKEDVIIPNADLISNQLTNYMFKDRLWRVICQVGVQYGSNTEKVKQALLDVAENHPDVLKEPPNAPVVLFQDFGDSSLVFELWAIIKDVNRKYYIASDLRFAIDQEFKKHDIVIAFPQRDIHIKDFPVGNSPPISE